MPLKFSPSDFSKGLSNHFSVVVANSQQRPLDGLPGEPGTALWPSPVYGPTLGRPAKWCETREVLPFRVPDVPLKSCATFSHFLSLRSLYAYL